MHHIFWPRCCTALSTVEHFTKDCAGGDQTESSDLYMYAFASSVPVALSDADQPQHKEGLKLILAGGLGDSFRYCLFM